MLNTFSLLQISAQGDNFVPNGRYLAKFGAFLFHFAILNNKHTHFSANLLSYKIMKMFLQVNKNCIPLPKRYSAYEIFRIKSTQLMMEDNPNSSKIYFLTNLMDEGIPILA